jgi:hypothetical protein
MISVALMIMKLTLFHDNGKLAGWRGEFEGAACPGQGGKESR